MEAGDRSATETVVVLVRHGESQGNVDGRFGGHGPTPLTELGQKQAELTAALIAERVQPTALISSDLLRAVQTAGAIAKAISLEPVLDRSFRERSVGVFDNMLFSEAKAQYPDLWKRMLRQERDATPPGGEAIDDVFERVSCGLDRVVETHRGGRVVIVSHGLAIFHAFSHICGLGSPSRGHKVFTLVNNCSLSTFTARKHKWRIQAINETWHLRPLD